MKNASFADEDFLRALYVTDEIRVEEGRLMIQVPEHGSTNLVGMKVDFDIKGRGPDPIVRSGKKVTSSALEALRKAKIGEVEMETSQFEGAYAVSDVVNKESGEVILEANNEIIQPSCRRSSKAASIVSQSFSLNAMISVQSSRKR